MEVLTKYKQSQASAVDTACIAEGLPITMPISLHRAVVRDGMGDVHGIHTQDLITNSDKCSAKLFLQPRPPHAT